MSDFLAGMFVRDFFSDIENALTEIKENQMALSAELQAALAQLSTDLAEVKTDLAELADRVAAGQISPADIQAIRDASAGLDEVSTGLDALAMEPVEEPAPEPEPEPVPEEPIV